MGAMASSPLCCHRLDASGHAARSDDELLALMAIDDTVAYRILVERHIDRVYAVALRILKNAADAEDVTQDAFVKAWQKRRDWQAGRAKFGTWLYRVTVNRSIDRVRIPRGACIDDVPEPVDESADALDSLHRRRLYGQLASALGRLPAPQRAALTLSYHEALGNREIAEVMGTTVFAVESLLKRGKQRLRELMKRSECEIRADLAAG